MVFLSDRKGMLEEEEEEDGEGALFVVSVGRSFAFWSF